MKQRLIVIFLFTLLISAGCKTKGSETDMQIDTGSKNGGIELAESKYAESEIVNNVRQFKSEKWFLAPEYQHWSPIQTECEKCIDQCLLDFQSIQPGMTRHEIMQKFLMDGGVQSVSTVRFLHPQCRSLKVNISFTFEKDPANQNRAVMDKNDKVIEASKPYLEAPFMD